nr:hypothetical protein [Tanacetum cinerariifolium]
MLDALALTPFYQAFLIIAEVPAIYMQEFWATVTVHKSSIIFTINKKKFSLDVEVFREIFQICPKVPGQRFKEPPLEHDILSFLRNLGHSGDVHYITDSISRRNKMFWHTAHDDTMFTSMKCVSKHKKTQVYGAILPRHLTNQAMLESIAYQTYYAYATGEKAPKEKYVQKKAESNTSPKKKTAPASKGFRLKSSAKVAKTDKKKQPAKIPKTKGLDVLTEVALAEVEQIKLATKRSKKEFHMSHASGSGNRVDTQSKVPDEQQQKVSSTNKGVGVRPEVSDVPKYDSESDEESWTFSQDENDADEETGVNDDSEETESDNDRDDLTYPNLSTYKADDEEEEEEKADNEEVYSDQRVSTLPKYELTKAEEENKEGEDEDMESEHEQDEEDDLYRDVNINLERSDAKMTNAQANQDTEDIHVTLTIVPLVVQQQSSSISLDLVSKFINPSSDQGSTTTTILTMIVPDIPNFASLFQFDQRVSALETEISKFKQTSQFADVVSSIPGIVDNYLTSKIKDALDVAIQLQTNKLREEAQAENQEFLNQIEKYVTESLEAKVLVRSTNQPQTSYTVVASFSEFKLKKILIDTMEENKSINRSDIQKNLYNALVESYNSDKDIITSYGDIVTLKRGRDDQDKDEDFSAGSNRRSNRKRSGKEAESSKEPTHKESKSTSSSKGNDDVTLLREALDDDESTSKNVVELEYHWEEVFKATNDRLDWHNPEGKPYPHDLSKPLSLILNERGRQVILLDHFINNDLEYLKEGAQVKNTPLPSPRRRLLIMVNHLEEIIVQRQNDQLYKFREGDFKRHCRQEIKDMLLLLVQKKLTNLNLEERNVRMNGEKKEALYTLRKKLGHQSDTKVFTMTMEILLESTSNNLSKDSILQAENLVKEILLKLNLPYHRSILADLKVTPTKHERMTKPYSSSRFIANCFNARDLKMELKVPDSSCLKDS